MIPMVMSIIAKTETFQRDMAKTRKTIGHLNKNFGTISRSVRHFGRNLLIMAGVGGLGYMIRQQMKAIDSTAKLSDRLGMTTEALIGMQHAASIAGVEQGTLNKSLEIFSRRLGEVDMGVGQAKYALDKLGLSYEELIGKSPDEAIGIVADQINKLGTQAEKAAAANYLFGRSGQQLLNMFEKGSAGLKEYEELMRKTGNAFTRLDAAKVEAANDALTNTRAIFTGIVKIATIELSPYIEAAATAFNNFATQGEGVGANVTNAFEMMTRSAIAFGSEIENLSLHLMKAHSWMLKMQGTWELVSPAGAANRLLRGEDEPSPWQRADILDREIQNQQRAAGGRDAATQQWFEDLRKEGGKPAIQWPSEGMSDTDIWLNQMKKKSTEELDIVTETNDAIIADHQRVIAVRVGGMEVYHDELQADMAQSALYTSDKFAEAARKIEGSMSGAFQSMITEGASWRDALGNFFMDVSNAFAQMASDMIARAIMMKIFGAAAAGGGSFSAASTGSGGYGGTGGGGPTGGASRSMIMHSGGVVGVDSFPSRLMPAAAFANAPRMHIGGLAGDEVPAILQKGERVIPKGGGGGGTVDVRIHNEGSEDLEISSADAYMDSDKRIIDVVMRASATHGPYRRSIKQVRK